MRYVPSGAPWSERGGRWRGVVDLVAGRYPRFLFGLGVGPILPVFHFHEATVAALAPALKYLADNRYRALTAADMAGVIAGRMAPPARAVVLAFDDAMASLWMVAYPLLREYGLRAIAYAIPGRIADAPSVRPTLEDGPVDAAAADVADNPLATWPELKAMAESGWIEFQSHTWSHSMIFSGHSILDVLRPEAPADHVLNRPRINTTDPPAFLARDAWGYPLYARRSRMSDALRYVPDEDDTAKVGAFVRERGGREFFVRPSWRRELDPLLRRIRGRRETEVERRQAIEHELVAARDTLEARLGTPVRHVCLPWGVIGRVAADLLPRLGFDTAVANRWRGMYAVRGGDHPFYVKRLPYRHIFALPGRGRRAFRTFA